MCSKFANYFKFNKKHGNMGAHAGGGVYIIIQEERSFSHYDGYMDGWAILSRTNNIVL